MEPPDTAERPVSCSNAILHAAHAQLQEEDVRHPSRVPAAGRGNSEDGTHWMNPSASQLFHACQRKQKPMAEQDKDSVALIHGEVIEKTWNEVLRFEQLHFSQCAAPKLSSFSGLQGRPSAKAKLLQRFGYALPWDRHDWLVDRCGQEIRYIIDYHHGLDERQPYIIDCRPDLTRFSNLMDRITVQYRAFKLKHRRGAGTMHPHPRFLTDMFAANESEKPIR